MSTSNTSREPPLTSRKLASRVGSTSGSMFGGKIGGNVGAMVGSHLGKALVAMDDPASTNKGKGSHILSAADTILRQGADFVSNAAASVNARTNKNEHQSKPLHESGDRSNTHDEELLAKPPPHAPAPSLRPAEPVLQPENTSSSLGVGARKFSVFGPKKDTFANVNQQPNIQPSAPDFSILTENSNTHSPAPQPYATSMPAEPGSTHGSDFSQHSNAYAKFNQNDSSDGPTTTSENETSNKMDASISESMSAKEVATEAAKRTSKAAKRTSKALGRQAKMLWSATAQSVAARRGHGHSNEDTSTVESNDNSNRAATGSSGGALSSPCIATAQSAQTLQDCQSNTAPDTSSDLDDASAKAPESDNNKLTSHFRSLVATTTAASGKVAIRLQKSLKKATATGNVADITSTTRVTGESDNRDRTQSTVSLRSMQEQEKRDLLDDAIQLEQELAQHVSEFRMLVEQAEMALHDFDQERFDPSRTIEHRKVLEQQVTQAQRELSFGQSQWNDAKLKVSERKRHLQQLLDLAASENKFIPL